MFFKSRWTKLPWSYNHKAFLSTLENEETPHIIHFLGPKPQQILQCAFLRIPVVYGFAGWFFTEHSEYYARMWYSKYFKPEYSFSRVKVNDLQERLNRLKNKG
jgi:lipopolysaccharide biosynthesis glycosyltransferase